MQGTDSCVAEKVVEMCRGPVNFTEPLCVAALLRDQEREASWGKGMFDLHLGESWEFVASSQAGSSVGNLSFQVGSSLVCLLWAVAAGSLLGWRVGQWPGRS